MMNEIDFLEIALTALAVLIAILALITAWLAMVVDQMRTIVRQLSSMNPEVPRDWNGRRFKERF